MRGSQSVRGRLELLWLAIFSGGLVLGLRLVQLQVIEKTEYRLAAERNRSHIIYQTAPRGRIYDRHGVTLATNQPAFSLIYLPNRGGDKKELERLAKALAKQLKQEPQEILATLQEAAREETAIRLAENLPPTSMFRLSELKTVYPGVDLVVEARRHYPFGDLGSHLIGYVGKMSPRSWKQLKKYGYRVDSRIGRLGLESIFEQELRGRDGGLRMEVDAQGRLKRILEKIAWKSGGNIHLTLDQRVQSAADEGLRKSSSGRGAAVALDPRSGDILALASAPSFDPNALLSSDREMAMKTAAQLPEFNLAISGVYPPGSAFKIIVSAAGFNEGRLDPEESIFCPGYFEFGRRIFLCWEHKGHKKVSWLTGLAKSCDVYFYQMGLKIGGAAIERHAKLFGLGSKTNVALKGEKSGNIFGPQSRAASHRPWYDGDTINLSIGQGELLVTPIQMAVVIAAVANRGILWRPRYTRRIEYADSMEVFEQAAEKAGQISLKNDAWSRLEEGLSLVVSSGSGRAAFIPGLDVRGKTGTAQNPLGMDHAWFVAYASQKGEEPSIAVAVVVENGGQGSVVAAPIARQMIAAAFVRKDDAH